MLQHLYIQNYAIISRLEVGFGEGLNIITGETGAGKSILMGALGLTLGDRADLGQLRDKENKSVIEAIFRVALNEPLKKCFSEIEIEPDGEIILRREIQPSGKSRAFINDTPVSLAQLHALSALLVDLHRQFDTLELSNRDFQRIMVDARAGTLPLMNEYTICFGQYSSLQRRISEVKLQLQKAEQEREYKLFLLTELEELNWQQGEEKTLDEELNLLSHAEQIRGGIGKATYLLGEGELPIVPQIKSMLSQLQAVSGYHPQLGQLVERLSSSYLELKDVHAELTSLLDAVVVDEKRMEQVNARLALAQKLIRKHGLASSDALVELRESLATELAGFQQASGELTQLEKEAGQRFKEASELAAKLSALRKKQIPLMEQETAALLQRVGMPNAALRIAIKEVALSASGVDEISFLFDANKSGQFEPLHKVASGGELSRLMLVLKSLVAGSLEMPTLIFDEIDSGISGEAAKQVGKLMEELSASHQLIAITHQPQIAARADRHLFIYKEEIKGAIQTQIKELAHEDRVRAIAQMLAGEHPGEAALGTARAMMQ